MDGDRGDELNAFAATDPRIWKSGDRVRKKKKGESHQLDTYFVPTLCFVQILFHASSHDKTIY